MTLSGTQVAKLGDRIRSGKLEPGDDELLADFLLSFRDFATDTFVRIWNLRQVFEETLAPFGASISERTIKSSRSIADKLVRQPTLRLDQIQDIVGCRMVVLSLSHQDEALAHLQSVFSTIEVRDRRKSPVNGYRALHAVVRQGPYRRMARFVRTLTSLNECWENKA